MDVHDKLFEIVNGMSEKELLTKQYYAFTGSSTLATIKAHGPREMPIWGTEFSIKAAELYVEAPYDSEAYVRNRVLALIDYLYRIQEK